MIFTYALYRGKPQDRIFAQLRYTSIDAANQAQFNNSDLHGLHSLKFDTPLSRAFDRQCRKARAALAAKEESRE
jgi:hypothetical protein